LNQLDRRLSGPLPIAPYPMVSLHAMDQISRSPCFLAVYSDLEIDQPHFQLRLFVTIDFPALL
jgi:hypothetical protein